jgi:hypothetical protein
VVAGLGSFIVRDLRPGDQPTKRLRDALEIPAKQQLTTEVDIAALLGGHGSRTSVLLVVDQLEELFTLASTREREQFLAGLRSLRANPRCVVILVLRADFFGALMESQLWSERRGQLSRVEVSPLGGEALRNAILAPAQNVGVAIEPELIERLLADAASEPGILPLLQETLVQLWDKRVDQTLTLSEYIALGDSERSGLAVAVARRADTILRRFTPTQITIARRILLRLVSFGEGRSDTRRQQPYANLCAAHDDAADFTHVLETLISERLLTISDEYGGSIDARIDLAHEVVITAWPTLAGWIRTYRTGEQWRRKLEAAAVHWLQHGRGMRALLDPLDLAEADAWQRTDYGRDLGPSEALAQLIVASRKEHHRRRRRRITLFGLGVTALVLGIIGTLKLITTAYDLDVEKRRSDLLIATSHDVPRRSGWKDDQPVIGDLLTVKARSRVPVDIRIYHGRATLVARCPNGPYCVQDEDQRSHIEYFVKQPGTHYVVLITGTLAMLATSPIDDFFRLAQISEHSKIPSGIEIQTFEAR